MVSCLQIAGCCPKNANHCLRPWNQEQAKDSGTGTAPHCSPSLQHTVLGCSRIVFTLVHKDTMRESDKSNCVKAMLEIRLCDVAELTFGKKKIHCQYIPPHARGVLQEKMLLLHHTLPSCSLYLYKYLCRNVCALLFMFIYILRMCTYTHTSIHMHTCMHI